MSRCLSSRARFLIGLVLMSLKASFDLSVHRTSGDDQVNRELAEEAALVSFLSDAVGGAVEVGRGNSSQSTLGVHAASRRDASRYADPGPRSNFAYAFVIGGCDLERKRYLGYVYNILVSTRILREEGSTADVVAYFQVSYASPRDTLPAEDVRLLSALGVRIKHIPKMRGESFYEIVLSKFRILSLTEYERVLLMDGDVMPLTNIDYLFELSANGTLKENVVVAGNMEPANAGFFLVAPGEGEYERILDIIRRREEKAVHLKGRKFDEVEGWGHVIAANDPWKSRFETGTTWTFHFAFSDQGLLYHYTKYVRESVSIIYGRGIVENWGTSGGGKVHLEETLDNPFQNLRTLRMEDKKACRKFMCDFYHFTGAKKPWMMAPSKHYYREHVKTASPKHTWWNTLFRLDKELAMGVDFGNWTPGRPSLGLNANFKQMNARVTARGSSTAATSSKT